MASPVERNGLQYTLEVEGIMILTWNFSKHKWEYKISDNPIWIMLDLVFRSNPEWNINDVEKSLELDGLSLDSLKSLALSSERRGN